jgi:hypothetical protein
MTPNQVELVAQAFYATDHSGDWHDAPDIVREEFRDLAREAISLVQQQTSHCRSSLMAKASEAAREAEITRRQWRHSRVTSRSD